MTPSTQRWIKKVAFLALTAAILTSLPAVAQNVSGKWLSPDWMFPGSRRSYSEQEVRKQARRVLQEMADEGVNSVFLETFLRGYSICPSIELDGQSKKARVVAYQPGTQSHPVYPHLSWNYRVEYDTVIDPLQIFIEEAQLAGVDVHAWVHLFYWRMDNTDIMLDWHDGPSLWGELMERYLRAQAKRISLLQDSSVKPGYEKAEDAKLGDDIRVELINQAADLFAVGCDVRELERILNAAKIETDRHPIGTLIAKIIAAGGERPDFLLMASDHDPFPAPRGRELRAIYVDPEHPEVRQILLDSIANIAHRHPGLAGIHLDHVRYSVDGQGLEPETGVIDGKYRYFEASNPNHMAQYRKLTETLTRRRAALTSLVKEIKTKMPRGLQLSAAVLPLYYRDRDHGKFRTSGYDYSSQAWLDWPVDFVVPMMYEYHPYLIRTLIDQYQALADSTSPEKPIKVYPGISRINYTRNGKINSDGWVFFDLTLARDIKANRREAEDLDFGGE